MFDMVLEEVMRKIPTSALNEVIDKLLDVVLSSPNAEKMPEDVAKTLLYYWRKGQLSTEAGLLNLMKASTALEPDKTVSLMEELGLRQVASALKETLKTLV